jgi:hypothetical protein
MNVIKGILSSKNIMQAYKSINTNFEKDRYPYESLVVGFMAAYALNKDKNKKKPKFEEEELIGIASHLHAEIFELKFELDQKEIDFEKVLDEIADISALCAGLVAYIMEHKDGK